jgi:hypothetical protein
MTVQHPGFLGFVQYLLFPLLALLLEAEGYILGRPFPVSAFAALFSLSLVLLIIYSPLIVKAEAIRPGAALALFTRGAYHAGIVMCVLSFLVFGLAVFRDPQSAVGSGILFLGLGSIWLPLAMAGASYGKMLATSESGFKDFLERRRSRRGFEAMAAGYLTIWLGNYEPLRRDPRPIPGIAASIAFSLIGWILLTLSGGLPYTLLGILILFIYLLVARLEARTWVPRDKRSQVLELLTASVPHI